MGAAETMPTADRRPWGLGHVFFGLLLAEAAVLAAIFAFGSGSLEGEFDDLSLEMIAVLQAALWLGTLGVPGWLVWVRGVSWSELGWGFRRRDTVSGLLIGIGTQVVAVPLLYLPLMLLVDDLDIAEPARDLVDKATGAGVVLLVLVVVVGAPIVEEVFYRGLTLRALEGRMRPAFALVVSSLLFAVIHFQVTQFPALLLFGLVAGRLAQKDGRIGRAIWAHIGFNATTIIILLLPIPTI